MSEFWKYFHDVLARPLIHAPGPLQAVVNGAALAMDTVRDDIVYFRNQWLPSLCEPELVADHGKSRGLYGIQKKHRSNFGSVLYTPTPGICWPVKLKAYRKSCASMVLTR